MNFAIPVPLTGGDLDRADTLRRDEGALLRLRQDANCRVLGYRDGKFPIDLSAERPRLALTPPAPGFLGADPQPLLLGLVTDGPEKGAARFAVDLTALEEDAALALWPQPPKLIDLRSISSELTDGEAAMAVAARSLIEWRRGHRFCPRCGGATVQAHGGWRQDCSSCGAPQFPRTDPVVIMLVVGRDPATGEERVVMGRQPNWPPDMHSLLAGFVEPGETVEAAVRRETMEEAGLAVGRVVYLASQPWPFVSNLMLGCFAEALGDALTPDEHELESCAWYTKSQIRLAFEGRLEGFRNPRPDAIATALLRAWIDGRAPKLSD